MSGDDIAGVGSSIHVRASPLSKMIDLRVFSTERGPRNNFRIFVRAYSTETVGMVKQRACALLQLDAEHQFLMHRNRKLSDNQTLGYYGVRDRDAAQIVAETSQAGTTSGFQMQMGPQEGVNDIFNVAQERYATQLVKLREMGFTNTEENMIALIATKGNLQAAFKRIRDGIPASTGNMDRAVLNSAEERYARQINQLVQVGFDNVQENVQALMATDGNAENAADLL